MNISKLNDWIQITAAAGVVVGLFLVAYEIGDSNRIGIEQANAENLTRIGEVYAVFSSVDGSDLFVRALEGELARTIRALGQVTEARVHLVLPKREVFSRKQQEATASVIIKTKGPKKLEKIQVLSIQHLIAAAVPSLKVSRISVIDHRGRLLARAGSTGEDGLSSASNNDEVQRSHEAGG